MDKVDFVERLENDKLSDLIRNARFLIMPSEGYYETFGMVIIEAFSKGVPVVASNIGVVPELVSDKVTGLLFEAGKALDLASKAKWMWEHAAERDAMGRNALKAYEARYTPDQHYTALIDLYKQVLESK